MADDAGEKTHDPTPHRRQKAREEGQVARSQDLGSALLLLAGTGALMVLGGGLYGFLKAYTERQLGGQAWLEADLGAVAAHWNGLLVELIRHVLPLLGALFVAALAVNFAQVGFLFLPEKVGFNLKHIDPLAGLGRIFSVAGVVRLSFGVFKILVIALVAGLCLYQELPAVLTLCDREAPQIAAFLGQTVLWTAMKVALVLLVLAIFDYGYQWWRHEQDLKMTTQEVREEMRNYEGDPQIASRRKAVQRQLLAHRLSEAVPKADGVITNPTELAVAIQFDPQKMAVPIVVAKGAGVLAKRIRQLALENGVPIVERKPLAQALYREVDVNKPIPQAQYAAVAEVLNYIYRLKGKRPPI